MATLEKNRQEKKHLFIFLVCFSHLPCYGYIGEKQTRKTHLFIFIVYFFSSALLRLHRRKIDKKNTPIYLYCLFFLISLATATSEKNRQEKHTYLSFLSVFSHLPCYGYIGEKQTRKMHLFIFLVCFFLICLLTATLERNRQEKIDTGGKNRQKKRVWGLKYETVVYISPFLSISCNVHTQVVQTSHFYPHTLFLPLSDKP